MTTPVNEKDQTQYPTHPTNRSSDEDRTVVGDGSVRQEGGQNGQDRTHLTVETAHDGTEPLTSLASPSHTREQAHRLDDDLAMLQVERQVSQMDQEREAAQNSKPSGRGRTRREDPVDEFEAATNPLHEKQTIYRPPENPTTRASKFFKKVHESSFLVRYFTYIVPVVAIILIPLLLGALVFENASVGGVRLMWFCVWLEIVWLTLWAGRIIAKCLPWPVGIIASLFTNNSKKWRDMAKQLEVPATIFFWWLGIEVSFLPTMTHHHIDGDETTKDWERTMNKVLIAFFVGAILNFLEKIIIQLIAISFHLRTYADRIDINKFQIASLTKLYKFSKEKIAMEDSEFEAEVKQPSSGARTPGQLVKEAQKGTKEAFAKFGDVAGRIAGDFTGRETVQSTHPQQVVLTLLNTTGGSQVLARRLYRTFARQETETVFEEDLKNAFDNSEESTAAFSMFDKDMNGDISMEELEAVCVEIGRERKSITASLKDLDSVVSRLDDVFVFIVAVITILVFISLISSSAAGALTSAGSTLLALSWLFSATAQEFLQSIIFVFVKHPFDVGDRVGIYGNTGAQGKGDDYFVKEISLLYTEFKKMEGHVVQAPNSYLNTLFILNQRRSGGLAEAVPVIIKFGTTLDQIDQLRQKLLDFVRAEKREYQANILTELREVDEAHSLTLNVVFFYKSNWQNELLRLQRRNKFICALMVTMQELGIEGPRMRYPGQKESFPIYLQNVPHIATPNMGHGGHPDNPAGFRSESRDPNFVSPKNDENGYRNGSMTRPAGGPQSESLEAMGRRLDFSLGMKDIASGDMTGDVYEDRERSRSRVAYSLPSPSQDRARTSQERSRASEEIASSTGRAPTFGSGRLGRVNTDESSRVRGSIHRNRFFGRHRAGSSDAGRMEAGMADIPEVPRSISQEHLDPRSGMVSPAAVRPGTNEGSVGPDSASAISDTSRGGRGPSGTHTYDYEMRRLA